MKVQKTKKNPAQVHLKLRCQQFPSFFHLNWVPPGKNISVKNPVSLYHYAKCNCFCDKMRKIFLFMLMHGLTTSILPCRGL